MSSLRVIAKKTEAPRQPATASNAARCAPLLAVLLSIPLPHAFSRETDDPPSPAPIASATPEKQASLLPSQPPSGIIDDLNLLSVKQRTAIARNLTLAAQNDDVFVYIITTHSLPAENPEAFIRTLLSGWERGRASGVILCLSERPDRWRKSFYVIPGGSQNSGALSQPEILAASAARSVALTEPDTRRATESACRELLKQLRSLPLHNAAQGTLTPAHNKEDARSGGSSSKLIKTLVNTGILFAAVAFATLFIQHRLKNRAVFLPQTEMRYRLNAPYSGGNSALLDFNDSHQHSLSNR